jgi:hypothetical protein
MQTALLTGFNPQGRRVSESIGAKYLAALSEQQSKPFKRYQYHGHEINGSSGRWFVMGEKSWPQIFTSESKARTAVDKCLSLRKELANQ